MIRKFSLILVLILIVTRCFAQGLIWNAGIHGFFDNREYFNRYAIDQTIFGVRPFGQVGLKIDQQNEFNVGVNFLYEFGSTLDFKYIQPILYYHYESEPVKLYLGAFERRKLVDMPLFLLSDTFQYYKPNMEGILLQLQKPWGSQNIWIDWISRQGIDKKEIFLIGGTGKLQSGTFFYRHDFLMEHYAKTMTDADSEHIHDNGGLYTGVGINLSHKSVFDSLSLSTGLAMSYDRIRNVYPLKYYLGSHTEFCIQYKSIGLHSILYFGDGQKQIVGDALYQAKTYERVDVYWRLFKNGPITGKVTFSLHFIENVMDYSQAFTIYMDLGGEKKFKSITSY